MNTTEEGARRSRRRALLEFLRLVGDGHAGVHGLHSQDLVVALLVVEHGGRKVLKDVLGREGTICLAARVSRMSWRWCKPNRPGSTHAR